MFKFTNNKELLILEYNKISTQILFDGVVIFIIAPLIKNQP